MPIFDPESDTVTGPLIPGAPDEDVLRGGEIQGAIVPGFGTSHQHVCALRFTDVDALRSFLAGPHAVVSTLDEVMQHRNRRRTALRYGLPRPPTPVMRAVALSITGLKMLVPDATAINDTPFKQGMKARSRYLGDPKQSGVPGHWSTWLFGGSDATVPHALVVLAAEHSHDLDGAVRDLLDAVGPERIIWQQRGAVLPGDKEHFGFRDGVSQIGVRGRLSDGPRHFLTRRWFDPADPRALHYARPGQPLVWPGQFIFGYHRGDPFDPLSPGQIKPGGAPWTEDGSLLVVRRLRQDVAAFRTFVAAEADRIKAEPGFAGITADALAAKIVGRWPDGSALARTPAGPSTSEAEDMLCTNAFDFFSDWQPARVCADLAVSTEPLGAVDLSELRTVSGAPGDRIGLHCPTFAHIRKVNPRGMNTDQGTPLMTRQFQMLRRGITWGSPYSESDPDDAGDRGLLFMSYQSSIANQFEKLTLAWMNLDDPPEGLSGHDLLVGQDNEATTRRAVLRSDDPDHPDARVDLSTGEHQPWITTTGGEYFFAPSRAALQRFSQS
jgi:Dyp-type peroxidase family